MGAFLFWTLGVPFVLWQVFETVAALSDPGYTRYSWRKARAAARERRAAAAARAAYRKSPEYRRRALDTDAFTFVGTLSAELEHRHDPTWRPEQPHSQV